MQIHTLFVLREGGVCLYKLLLSKKFKENDIDLITPFFSAILSFSENVVAKKLEVLEMSDIRIVFKKDKGFIFIIVADSRENLLFINSRLTRIISLFFREYKHLINDNESETIENPELDKKINDLILGKDETSQILSQESYNKILNYFSEQKSQNEIIGAAILTTRATIIYSSLTTELMNRAMKELEIRYMSGTFDVPELFYTLGNGEKVCEKSLTYHNFINLLLIIHFPKSTSLGMVDYKTESIVEAIKKYLG